LKKQHAYALKMACIGFSVESNKVNM